MRIKWFLSIFSVAVGVPIVTLLAAPQLGSTVQVDPKQAVREIAHQASVTKLEAPTSGGTRISPSRKSGARRMHDSSLGDAPADDRDSLAVVVDGRTIDATPVTRSMAATLPPGAWYNLSVFVPNTGQPATGQNELFILGIPNIPATLEAPLLVGMHQYGASHGDIPTNTTFWNECLARGWYLLAPLSRGIQGYADRGGSTLNAQANTEAAIAWVTGNYPIDGDRIYGVGFSGGAGLLASYASRHLDPAEPMFAAIAYHTGFSDMVDVYNTSDTSVQSDLQTLLGGTPSTALFEYRRISTLELHASRLWLDGGDHGAWNLGSIPTQIWYATNDFSHVLVSQTSQLFDWMNSRGSFQVSLITGVNSNPAPSNGHHNWTLLNETQICNWFSVQTLTHPDSGDLLIDRDATYHDYAVQQDTAGGFSRLRFNKIPANNQLALTQTDNVQRITLSPDSINLYTVPGVFLTLDLEAVDSGDEIVLEGVQAAPLALGVQRDGTINTTWIYSATQQTLTIAEPQTGMHRWVIQF